MIDFTLFYDEQKQFIKNIKLKYKRYLYEKILWDERSILITGQRGVGKTTLMLQHLKEHFDKSLKALYISVDNPYFKAISLYEFAIEFEKYGGEILYIDEIHKLSDWSSQIKSIYDSTKLKLVISGSSMIQINSEEDLSRRVKLYKLANLSFREYLRFKNIASFNSFSLEELFSDHVNIASSISAKIKPLMHFREYLIKGCYPFILQNNQSYTQQLIEVINQTIEVDMPYVTNIRHPQIDKIKKLIYLLSISAPVKPNISKLASSIGVSRPTLMEYLHYLELGSLLNSVNQSAKGYGVVSKPDKIYMYNTNLIKAISHNANIGTQREVFFVNQIKSAFYDEAHLFDDCLLLSKQGDFLVKNQFTVEIGGRNKSFERPSKATTPQDKVRGQIQDVTSSFVVADDIEVGFGAKIPLWLFGFLY